MQPSEHAIDATRASFSVNWKNTFLMTRFDGQPHDIYALLTALGIAAKSNQQLATCLQALGTATLLDFELYAESETAAFVH